MIPDISLLDGAAALLILLLPWLVLFTVAAGVADWLENRSNRRRGGR